MIKVLLKAKDIPLDSIVTKRNGDKKYTLRKEIRVFGENGEKRSIEAKEGAVFIVSKNGDANAIAGDVELLWYASEESLADFIEDCDQS